jgi:hypothetical protein
MGAPKLVATVWTCLLVAQLKFKLVRHNIYNFELQFLENQSITDEIAY